MKNNGLILAMLFFAAVFFSSCGGRTPSSSAEETPKPSEAESISEVVTEAKAETTTEETAGESAAPPSQASQEAADPLSGIQWVKDHYKDVICSVREIAAAGGKQFILEMDVDSPNAVAAKEAVRRLLGDSARIEWVSNKSITTWTSEDLKRVHRDYIFSYGLDELGEWVRIGDIGSARTPCDPPEGEFASETLREEAVQAKKREAWEQAYQKLAGQSEYRKNADRLAERAAEFDSEAAAWAEQLGISKEEYIHVIAGPENDDFIRWAFKECEKEIKEVLLVRAIAGREGINVSREELERCCAEEGLDYSSLAESEKNKREYLLLFDKVADYMTPEP